MFVLFPCANKVVIQMQCPSYHVIPCVCSLLTAQSGQEGQRGDAELERTCRWQSHGFWPWWWERQGNGQCQERRELLRTRGCLRLVSARQYPSARLNTLQDAALALSSHTACAREHSREHKMRDLMLHPSLAAEASGSKRSHALVQSSCLFTVAVKCVRARMTRSPLYATPHRNTASPARRTTRP